MAVWRRPRSQTQTSLTRERSTAEYRQPVEACQRAAQRMRRVIETLLELARLDAGEEPIKSAAFDLARTAADAVELIRPLAAERRISLRADLAPTDCWADAEQIAQVITNLLTNAIQYNKDAGEMRISTRSENGSALVIITDTGPGIASEHLPHIFDRFYRVGSARSAPRGRTGLGLAITKALIEAHGGSIEVSSQLGAGTTFLVRLPPEASAVAPVSVG